MLPQSIQHTRMQTTVAARALHQAATWQGDGHSGQPSATTRAPNACIGHEHIIRLLATHAMRQKHNQRCQRAPGHRTAVIAPWHTVSSSSGASWLSGYVSFHMHPLTTAHLQGMASIIQNVDVTKMTKGVSATLQAGIDPAALTKRFQQSPSLAKAMENPRVMAALMDMARWGQGACRAAMNPCTHSRIANAFV